MPLAVLFPMFYLGVEKSNAYFEGLYFGVFLSVDCKAGSFSFILGLTCLIAVNSFYF